MYIYICIYVKVKKFESVERECDDLDVGPRAMIVLLILTIAFAHQLQLCFHYCPSPCDTRRRFEKKFYY